MRKGIITEVADLIRRVFVEKKADFAVEAEAIFSDLKYNLGVEGLEKVRLLNRYDLSGISDEEFSMALTTILSEPPVDSVYLENFSADDAAATFVVEFLPGQYDQRADSAIQCIQLISKAEHVIVKTARVFVLYGKISQREIERIKNYSINPVEAREASVEKTSTLELQLIEPDAVKKIEGFINMSAEDLSNLLQDMALAMNSEDLAFCQNYFKEEGREPTVTEIKLLDTYWSDHCRHTTFNTIIDNVEIVPHKYNTAVQMAYDLYIEDRQKIYQDNPDKPVTLMDIAVLGMKKLRAQGLLEDLDQSEEVNACSINIDVDVEGKTEKWLLMFKNETHNHPTEIEPFGGAATCLGGAIRDPLSGRSYVYQAMRVTGGADPRASVEFTIEGKLPQRKIAVGAAAGYSSYGNQIGLSTGRVQDFYHERFIAKRMEVGAVIGAVPKDYVVRHTPEPGDQIILLGGKTGRDGCGGATGSSKEHNVDSLTDCGAEVQKGNATVERKILRMFRNPDVTKLIKRSNDFGAGGVSVAIGELADGVKVNLDTIPKKYEGLDGTELAISESQERMAVVLAQKDCAKFIEIAAQENLEATVVAEVTEEKRVIMYWRGVKIVDISRDFLNTNGVQQHANAVIKSPVGNPYFYTLPIGLQRSLHQLKNAWLDNLSRLEVCSQKGLVERFDSTIGRASVLMPLGGKKQLTPAEGMAANIPVLSDKVKTASIMTYGYNAELACWSPFYGAFYAIFESVCRAVCMGADPDKIRLSLQEYFEKMINEESWGNPFSALLGAYLAQIAFDVPAIGGKDSMSGTFMDMHVPPTLVSFAVATAETEEIISSEFKKVDSKVVFLACEKDENDLPDFGKTKIQLATLHKAIKNKMVLSASTVKEGGIAAAISLMCFGNEIGFAFGKHITDVETLFMLQPGGFILEMADDADFEEFFEDLDWLLLGKTVVAKEILVNGECICLEEAQKAWEGTLNDIFPAYKQVTGKVKDKYEYKTQKTLKHRVQIAKPSVFIPVFPGSNCEYDTARAFEAAGGKTQTFVVKNFDNNVINDSVKQMAKAISNSQILALIGGFSAADEPDGSGKFIATMFRNPYLKEAITDFLENKDGLLLGICNGFQALVKLGLLPYGKITDLQEDSPTLTFNAIGRHMSTICNTKVVSNLSPWLYNDEVGEMHKIALSSGEGRFFANDEHLEKLFAAGQVATQYTDLEGNVTMQSPHNPNGSVMAIEGLTSPDGRIFGKMCHSERWIPGLMKNIPGNKEQGIFRAGINYFV